MGDASERLWALLGPYLAAEGLELYDVELLGGGRGRVLRVTLDAAEGIDVERIAETSRAISRILDEEDVVPGSYTLEVTSPGLERRLRRPAHFRGARGREVVVKTFGPVDGERTHRGVLVEADEEGFSVETADRLRRIAFAEVASARTVFRWERGGKPR